MQKKTLNLSATTTAANSSGTTTRFATTGTSAAESSINVSGGDAQQMGPSGISSIFSLGSSASSSFAPVTVIASDRDQRMLEGIQLIQQVIS